MLMRTASRVVLAPQMLAVKSCDKKRNADVVKQALGTGESASSRKPFCAGNAR